MNKYLYLIVALLLFTGCAKRKNTSTSYQLPTNKLVRFGAGGGVTGNANGYLLKSNGGFYSWNKDLRKEYAEILLYNPTKDSIELAFSMIDRIQFEKIEHSELANFTYFVETSEDERIHTVTWGSGQPPEDIIKLYELLIAFIPKNPK